jgi:hypothetical protein
MAAKGKPLKEGTPLSALEEMSFNARGALKAADFQFLEEVVAFTDEELLALPRVGPGTVDRLRRWQRGEDQPPSRTGADDDERVFIAYAAHHAAGKSPEEAIKNAAAGVEEFDRLKDGARG